ncbi:MAG: C25 family cysteine peptidase [Mariniblastus sp.]|nr:C25 family cysteine peptidase [Mariniblastus sp.]
MSPAPSARGIKKQIADAATTGALKHVFLVGDAGDRNARHVDLVPTDYVAAKVNVRFGSEPEIATDHTYADLNDDGIQDLSIGRLPVDSALEVDQFTDRIIKYEAGSNNEAWRRRVNIVAGVGGFGQLIDGLIEQTTKQILTDLVPSGYATKMTYGSWSSPYCPDPRKFSDVAIKRFNEGCLFWVYIGHGARHQLDQVYLPDQRHRILDGQNVSQLNCQSGNPIAIFLACYTGATDHPNDCLAEKMLRQNNGPIATICGTRVTMPYAMSLLSLEMVHEFFNGEVETLGELTMVAKQRMVEGSDNNREYRELIEGMGQTFSPAPKLLEAERLEHVQLIHLMGDPLLRLKRPQPLFIRAPAVAMAGDKIQIKGMAPHSGKLTIELAYQRDRLRYRPPRRKEYDSSHQSFEQYQQTYEQVQNLVHATKTLAVPNAGELEAEMQIPKGMSGRCVVRAMLISEQGFCLGSSSIDIKKASNRSAKHGDTKIK